jgi:hypothetical protein
MPFLDASALTADPHGLAYLGTVLRLNGGAKAGPVRARLTPLLGQPTITLNRVLIAGHGVRKSAARESGGVRLAKGRFGLSRGSGYHIKVRT